MKLEDLDLLDQACILRARKNFYAYRQYIHDCKLKKNWFVRELSYSVQSFWDKYIAGEQPIMVIQAPPQHGKSQVITDAVTWFAGKRPDLRFIYASFSERLGIRCNKAFQRITNGKKYKNIFPNLDSCEIIDKNDLSKNSSFIEFGNGGSFRNTTVNGAITGESLDIGLIDDPIRGRKDANSSVVRNAAWDWFTNDFFTRFDETAGTIIVLTRWHVDDPVGRLLESELGERVIKLSYPAIAEMDEEHRKEGEPLFPEHKSLEFLLKRKKVMSPSDFSALYQQNPYIQGGEMFKNSYWNYWEVLPRLRTKAIFADTACKEKERNDYSVFQCWGLGWHGGAYLIDQIRGKWESPELITQATAFYNKHRNADDCFCSKMVVEDKSSGTSLIQHLKKTGRVPIVALQRDKDKVLRANDAIPYISTGQVFLPKNAPWLSDYLKELSEFPNGVHDDQVDPTADAIVDLIGTTDKTVDYGAILDGMGY